MLKLMKYEFRKTMFSKMILLSITAVLELMYLAGLFFEQEKLFFISMPGLLMCASFGVLYIGLESLSIFQRDLNTKQSYMLFMTPHSSYKILGAKVLENGISILGTGVCYILLAALDITAGVLRIGGLKEFMDFFQSVMGQINVNLTQESVVLVVMVSLVGWLSTIVTGYLAIVLSATVLAGKRFSGALSFILFLVLNGAVGFLFNLLPDPANQYADFGLSVGVTLAVTVLMYGIAGWIMEKKLSV